MMHKLFVVHHNFFLKDISNHVFADIVIPFFLITLSPYHCILYLLTNNECHCSYHIPKCDVKDLWFETRGQRKGGFRNDMEKMEVKVLQACRALRVRTDHKASYRRVCPYLLFCVIIVFPCLQVTMKHIKYATPGELTSKEQCRISLNNKQLI